MLVINRLPKKGFSLLFKGARVNVMIDSYNTDTGARICIDAPNEVTILRDEVSYEDAQKGNFSNVKSGNAPIRK